ncbi:MAG: hypothetical protein IJ390_02570 [Lachnospiraceae bacterium]|nr:hypothetical protein [Lachnospiraceae bacterium]
MLLYDFLKSNYEENEPIFLSDIKIEGMSDVNIRQQIKKLTDEGMIKRFDTGIYFLPKKSIFRSGSQLSKDRVIELKYLQEQDSRCGYVTGLMFANQLGVTTQVPMVFEVVSNKATKDYRETTLANTRVIIRKPRVTVNEENYRILQFLDLLKDIDLYAEISGEELQRCLLQYMKRATLDFAMLEPYLSCYPDKIYRNMYETRLLYGVSS